jgi:hypothetical protein
MSEPPDNGRAEVIAWEAPGGIPKSLAASPDHGGSLTIRVEQGAVTIHGKQCRYVVGHPKDALTRPGTEKVLAEVHMTLPLERCQITWKYAEAD